MKISLAHAAAVWRRNASMYGHTWMYNLLPNFFEPVLYLVAIGVGVGAYVSEMAGQSYAAFLAPGLVCVAAMNGASFEATYNVYVRLTWDKAYDAMLTTPIGSDEVLLGELMWAVTRASIYGASFFVVLVGFGLAPLPQALYAIPAIPLSGLLFAAIGLAFTLRVPTIDVFAFYFTLFLTPLFLFSDVFFPLAERLPGRWLLLAEALPLLHPVRIARTAFRGEFAAVVLWDTLYILIVAAALLSWTRTAIRRRLVS